MYERRVGSVDVIGYMHSPAFGFCEAGASTGRETETQRDYRLGVHHTILVVTDHSSPAHVVQWSNHALGRHVQ